MLERKITLTKPDRDRLVEVTRAQGVAIRWALFVDNLQKEIDKARIVEPKCVARDVVIISQSLLFRGLAAFDYS